jgi:hypothetical protein
MGYDPRKSGYNQPKNIDVVHSILARAMHHTTPRDHYTRPGENAGIGTVIFHTKARYMGKLNTYNFAKK